MSRNVKSLEAKLGARLFTRTTRSVRLTAEGTRSRGLYAVYPTRRYLPRRVSASIDALHEHCRARTDLAFPPEPSTTVA